MSLPAPASAEKIAEVGLLPQKLAGLKAPSGEAFEGGSVYPLLWLPLLAGAGLVFLCLIYGSRALRLKGAERAPDPAESEMRFRATFDQAAVGIAHVAEDGRFLRANRKFCAIVGYTQEELLKLSFHEITHPADLDMDLAYLQQVIKGEIDTYSMEKRYICKDGSLVWISLSVSLLRNPQGDPKVFVSVVKDISDRVKAKEALDQSFRSLEHVTTTVPDAVFSVKLPERVTQWCNDSYDVLGYAPAECIGESTAMLYPSDEEAAKVGDLIDKAIASDAKISRSEVMLRHKSGRVFPAEISLSVFMEHGKPVSVTALARDISQRKQAEAELQESHDALKHLLSSIPDAVFFVRLPERVIEWADDSYDVMGLGTDPSEVQGHSTQDYFASAEDYQAFGEVQRQAIAEGKGFMRTEAMTRHQNGTIFPAEITATFCRKNGVVTGANAIVRDITNRKRAEKRILDYQERLRRLASSLIFAEERERRTIAADLHDGAAQSLALARLKLAEACAGVEGSPTAGTLAEASQLVRQSLHQVRDVLLDLSSPTLERLGLAAGLQDWLTTRVGKAHNLITEFRDECGDLPLTKEARMLLFRSACELVTNVVKHAKAGRVCVHLACPDQEFQITVKDDGLGFDPGVVLKSAGSAGAFGLFSIQERMKDLGGLIEISSAPGKGCEVSLMMPLKENTEKGGQE